MSAATTTTTTNPTSLPAELNDAVVFLSDKFPDLPAELVEKVARYHAEGCDVSSWRLNAYRDRGGRHGTQPLAWTGRVFEFSVRNLAATGGADQYLLIITGAGKHAGQRGSAVLAIDSAMVPPKTAPAVQTGGAGMDVASSNDGLTQLARIVAQQNAVIERLAQSVGQRPPGGGDVSVAEKPKDLMDQLTVVFKVAEMMRPQATTGLKDEIDKYKAIRQLAAEEGGGVVSEPPSWVGPLLTKLADTFGPAIAQFAQRAAAMRGQVQQQQQPQQPAAAVVEAQPVVNQPALKLVDDIVEPATPRPVEPTATNAITTTPGIAPGVYPPEMIALAMPTIQLGIGSGGQPDTYAAMLVDALESAPEIKALFLSHPGELTRQVFASMGPAFAAESSREFIAAVEKSARDSITAPDEEGEQ